MQDNERKKQGEKKKIKDRPKTEWKMNSCKSWYKWKLHWIGRNVS